MRVAAIFAKVVVTVSVHDNNTKLLKGARNMNEEKYYCAMCGKSYESVKDRIACETECYKNYMAAEAKKKSDEAKAKRDSSTKAIENKLAELNKMIESHLREYEYLNLTRHYPYISYVFKKPVWWF